MTDLVPPHLFCFQTSPGVKCACILYVIWETANVSNPGFSFLKGIEMKFKKMLFPLIVCPAWIPELNSVKHGPEGKAAPCFPWSPSGTGVGSEVGRR